jgi:hypothetical protein
VRTHVASSGVAERLPAMCGSETFATAVSSTSMNVASITEIAMSHGLKRGTHSTGPPPAGDAVGSGSASPFPPI